MSLFVMVQLRDSPAAIVPLQPAVKLGAYPVTDPSATLYEPGLSVRVVPLSLPANGAIAAPLLVTVMEKSEATFVPPSSLTTCLMTVSEAVGGAMSSLVTVHVLVSLIAIVPAQPEDSDFAYPFTTASSTLYGPALIVTSVPASLPANVAGVGEFPVTVIVKSAAVFVPPSSFTTCFTTRSCARSPTTVSRSSPHALDAAAWCLSPLYRAIQ